MPIRINADLPAKKILEHENIFVMDYERSLKQDIRPLKIIIMNLIAYQTGNGASAFKESF